MKKVYLLFLTAILFAGTQSLKAQGKDVALETLGATSAIAIYNTYVAIGAIADYYNDDGYDDDEVVSYMDEQISSMELMKEQFTTLLASGFITDPEDKNFLSELIITFDYLKKEAGGLRTFALSEDGSVGLDQYDKYRDLAWDKITVLLGIED